MNSSALSLSSVEPLSGLNFKRWKQDIEILLGLMDLDLAFREDEPAALTDGSTAEERHKHEKWEKANRMSLMVMKRTMNDTVRGVVIGCEKAKDFLEAIGPKFKEFEKAEMGELMTTLTTLKFDEGKGVREHILKLVNTAAKLKYSISRSLTIYCDNKAAVFFSKNNKKFEATRLMNIKYLSVKEHVRNGEITIEHIETNLMIADPLTKPLAVGAFKDHVYKMGVLESLESAEEWE